MEQSILSSTKKVLHIGPDDTSFDLDIMTHINSAFSDLNDIGVGPAEGFVIEDDEPVWDDFLTGNVVQQSRVKTFVFLKTRLLFDPPQTTFHLASQERQLEEVTWRLNVRQEATDWVDPDPPIVVEEDQFGEPIVMDGGGA